MDVYVVDKTNQQMLYFCKWTWFLVPEPGTWEFAEWVERLFLLAGLYEEAREVASAVSERGPEALDEIVDFSTDGRVLVIRI